MFHLERNATKKEIFEMHSCAKSRVAKGDLHPGAIGGRAVDGGVVEGELAAAGPVVIVQELRLVEVPSEATCQVY